MTKRCFRNLARVFSVMAGLLLTHGAFAQPSVYNTTNWRFSNPRQFGFLVNDIDFVDNSRGIAVGANSGIAYTTDGGVNWRYGAFLFGSPAGSLTGATFQDVHFVTTTLAYAVGTNGCMAKTTDGGATWTFVNNPLYAGARAINSVWFVNPNKGYIGGQHNNTPDQTPKLYVTNNGGATWDSLAAPVGGKTVVGYPNNPNVAPLVWDVTARGKDIQRIQFVNENLGYISGGGLGLFEPIPNVSSTVTCLPAATTTTTGSHHASLLWKFTNGTLTDYSVSKERLGYNGIYNAAPSCTYRYASNSIHTQTIRAFQIINDTLVLLLSSNNNIVIRVSTGPNSFTPNINVPAVTEIGRYTLLNAPTPPQNNSSALGAPIPANPTFTLSNPNNVVRAANGKLLVPVASPVISPANRMMTSVDTGRTWVEERWLPTGRTYSSFGGPAIDILPSGRIVVAGQNGVIADSVTGGVWSSSYLQPAIGSYNKIDFADCSNGLVAGGGFIARTFNGGNSWDEVIRGDFVSLNIGINSVAYVPRNPALAYFATSSGSVYKSTNINAANPASVILDPVFANGNEQIQDVAAIGNDSVWACGQSGFAVPTASRSPKIFRSTNGGLTWTTISSFPAGSTSQGFRHIEFPSRQIGYVSGTRDTVWKTTDGGVTWSKLPLPTPGITPQITYGDMFALNDNTVFLVGNGFPRKVVFRTTDGGNTWQDISGNVTTQPVGNLNSVVFHDLNNGYIGCAGGFLVTNNGGTTWRLEQAPTNSNHTSLCFAPRTVPAGTPFENRRLFTSGVFSNHIMEFGNPANLNVSSTETTTSSCDNAAQGSITVNASGGIPPYTFSINGGAFQASNTFSNLTPGPKTITIRDAACGLITKTVTVPTRPAPVVTAGPDRTIVEGFATTLQGSVVQGNGTAVAWTPNSTLTGANTFSPEARPLTTTTYTMTVTDANGCVGTDNAIVTVLPYCLKVMDAFTPNNDGLNDRWIVTNNGGACADLVKVAVFNRYGGEVYRNDNYTNNWDGTYKGKPVADGTYYYVVTIRLINGTQVTVKGDVTILR